MKPERQFPVIAAVVVLTGLISLPAHGQLQYEKLKSFDGFTDGAWPLARLLEGSDGSLYGTSWFGGTNSVGTVFKLNRDGSGFTALYHFGGSPGDGKYPKSGLIEGGDGTLYGVTDGGGFTNRYVAGDGTVFKLNKDGTGYSALYKFGSVADDGVKPDMATLLKASDGKLYGTTTAGGIHNRGAVFRLNPDGTGYALLHHFGSVAGDGWAAIGGMVEGGDGMLYGASFGGGSENGPGTVFKLNNDGSGYSILRSFSENGGDGQNPGGLLAASDGALYGMTLNGGSAGTGTIFKINTNGTGYAIIHNFSANPVNGQFPGVSLLEGGDGLLYGVTYGDPFGSEDGDVVFSLNRNGSGYTILHRFGSIANDGRFPVAGLIQGSDGAFYGSTQYGGENNSGTLFRLHQPTIGASLPQFWEMRQSGTTGALNAVIYTNSQFVAVGDAILTSQDGSNWTTRVVSLPEPLYDVTYGDGQFVAVGGHRPAFGGDVESTTVMTSPDGVVWTQRSVPTTNALLSVAWGNGIFVVVGLASPIVASLDGFNWVEQLPLRNLTDIVFGDGRFVAVGPCGVTISSTNGSDWNVHSRPAFPGWCSFGYGLPVHVAYGSGKWLIAAKPLVGTGAEVCEGIGGFPNHFDVSSDLVNWSSTGSGAVGANQRIRFLNGSFVSVGGGAHCAYSYSLMSSQDGLIWSTPRVLVGSYGDVPPRYNDVAFGNGTYVAVGHGGRIIQSVDSPRLEVKLLPVRTNENRLIEVNGPVGVHANVEATSALAQTNAWSADGMTVFSPDGLYTGNVLLDGIVRFTDTQFTNSPQQYYRARLGAQ